MTTFDLWTKNCEKCGIEIWKLEGSEETGLYETRESYTVNNQKYYRESVYHIWVNGKWMLATLNYQNAHNIWEEARNENEEAHQEEACPPVGGLVQPE